ncbi:MAG TPA: asparagine--tRNA ligase [Pirellulaceae bacterium]|nr:asparagine--tRNA ligase [Pirellulaceae bacterium]
MAEPISVVAARQSSAIGKSVVVKGWLRTRRDSKAGFSFLEINDGSSLGNLQALAPADLPNYDSVVKHLSAGSSLIVEGTIQASQGGEQATELVASSVTLIGEADPEKYPLQKKRHSFEKLREWAHLRPRTNALGAVARVRNCVSRSVHDFFQEEGFLYVHTPIITSSDAEGAGSMFRVTTVDPAKPPMKEGKVDWSRDFFGRPTYLTVSGQLEGEIYACALGKIYTFGPTFRAENSNTSRHLAEFWMIEPEAAFFELEDDMDLAERFVQRLCRDALERCDEDLQFFNERVDDTVLETLKSMVSGPFVRMSYTEAIERLQKSGKSFEYAPEWGNDLQSEHERYLAEELCKRPVIVHDYPRGIKAFYMRLNEDEQTVRAMDVLAPRVGEIIGGSQREERLDVLTQRMIESHLDPKDYWWYLELREFGSVPHAGFGLGLERAVQFITGMTNIRDVIPFPRTPGSAEF